MGIKAYFLISIFLLSTLGLSHQLDSPSTKSKSKSDTQAVTKSKFKKSTVHLYVIARHGSRAPSKKSVLSFQHENFKKLDAGEITELGSAQSFIYGRALAERYGEFFSAYNVTDPTADSYRVYYHDKDRIRDTAINVLDGIFGNYRNFDPKILNQKLVYPPFPKPDSDLTKQHENYKSTKTKAELLGDNSVEYPIENLYKKDPMVFKTYDKNPVLKAEHKKNREMGFYEHSNLKHLIMQEWEKTELPKLITSIDAKSSTLLGDYCICEFYDVHPEKKCTAKLKDLTEILMDFKLMTALSHESNKQNLNPFVKMWLEIIDRTIFGSTAKPFEFWAVGDTFLGPLVSWLTGNPNSHKAYRKSVIEGAVKDSHLRRPKFHSNIVIETYNYPESPQNKTLYVNMMYNGEEIRPWGLGKGDGEIRLIDLRNAIISNKQPERWDFIRQQSITDHVNGIVPPMVKYQVPIMVFAIIMIVFCLNITRSLLTNRRGWVWDKWCKKGDAAGKGNPGKGDPKKREVDELVREMKGLQGIDEKLDRVEKKLR